MIKSTLSERAKSLHGVLVAVGDLGVLITGDPGIGKSDCALQLLVDGHALVADDVVEIEVVQGKVFGRAPERFRGILVVYGLGPIDVLDVFGQKSFRERMQIDLCIELCEFGENDPLAGKAPTMVLGIVVPAYRLPYARSRNVSLLVLSAVALFRSNTGRGATKRFIDQHDSACGSGLN